MVGGEGENGTNLDFFSPYVRLCVCVCLFVCLCVQTGAICSEWWTFIKVSWVESSAAGSSDCMHACVQETPLSLGESKSQWHESGGK